MAEGELIRRAEAMRRLGLSRWQWDKLVETKALTPIYLYPKARALFKRSEVEQVKTGER